VHARADPPGPFSEARNAIPVRYRVLLPSTLPAPYITERREGNSGLAMALFCPFALLPLCHTRTPPPPLSRFYARVSLRHRRVTLRMHHLWTYVSIDSCSSFTVMIIIMIIIIIIIIINNRVYISRIMPCVITNCLTHHFVF